MFDFFVGFFVNLQSYKQNKELLKVAKQRENCNIGDIKFPLLMFPLLAINSKQINMDLQCIEIQKSQQELQGKRSQAKKRAVLILLMLV